MPRRILTALVAVPVLLLIILKGPAWLFLALTLAFAAAGFWEFSRLASKLGWKPLRIGYPLVAAMVTSFYPGLSGFEEAGIALVVVVGIVVVFFRKPGVEALGGVAATVLGVIYLGSLLGSIVGLRTMAPDRAGRMWVLFLLAVVMIGDAGAYYVGRALGRTPLAPALSPKKTVEGLVGGLVFSVATAIALRSLVLPQAGVVTVIGLALTMAILAVVGDLFESLLKRSAGMKDTSTLIPGHGGVLDRIDSLLFAAAFLFLYAKWAPVFG